MHNGRSAGATILEMKDTGITLNKSPYARFRLRIEPDKAAPYETSVRAFVSRIAISNVGDQVQVKYDPANPQHVIMV